MSFIFETMKNMININIANNKKIDLNANKKITKEDKILPIKWKTSIEVL